jgi:hypothetical protein
MYLSGVEQLNMPSTSPSIEQGTGRRSLVDQFASLICGVKTATFLIINPKLKIFQISDHPPGIDISAHKIPENSRSRVDLFGIGHGHYKIGGTNTDSDARTVHPDSLLDNYSEIHGGQVPEEGGM